jgi:hypothetical protein
LYFNPLSLILKVHDIPQGEGGDANFIIHHNFAGHPEYESSMRVEIHADEKSFDFIENLADLRVRNPDHVLNMNAIDWKRDERLIKIIKVLIYQGFLVIDE